MIIFAQLCLVGSLQLLMFVESQDIGKYAYSSKDFTLTMRVYDGAYVAVAFEVPGKLPFLDGSYPLVKRPNHFYDVDFSDMYEGVGYWHINIGALLGGESFNPGDLTFLAYRAADSIAVNFGDQGLTLKRVGYDYFPATFVYLTTDESQLRVTVQTFANETLRVIVSCQRYGTAASDLDLKEVIEGFKKGDLSYVSFVTQGAIVVPSKGARLLLNKVTN
ncbi:hypothetical protein FOZ63_025871 [Perkinsus olseni]|uniref:Uncharacterized protein n=1 Tax=Perkinsus olseni TaxID=32597 RepID=A0A7J6TY87_PEROL|nr:hypothetical protein FOZ62_030174 [Perkinsus olseni]KAF4749602.1 hypothetical protein FOZ63_025871 [Perkinsus olseni]